MSSDNDWTNVTSLSDRIRAEQAWESERLEWARKEEWLANGDYEGPGVAIGVVILIALLTAVTSLGYLLYIFVGMLI